MPALQVVHHHVVALAGHDVGPHGDYAAAADGQQGNGDVVVAAPEGEVGPHAVGDLHGVGHVPAGLLDAADVGVPGEPLHVLHGDGAAGQFTVEGLYVPAMLSQIYFVPGNGIASHETAISGSFQQNFAGVCYGVSVWMLIMGWIPGWGTL